MCLTKGEEELLNESDRIALFDRKTTLAIMFKLSQQVEKGWPKLRGFKEIPFLLEGKPYHNGSRMENVVA